MTTWWSRDGCEKKFLRRGTDGFRANNVLAVLCKSEDLSWIPNVPLKNKETNTSPSLVILFALVIPAIERQTQEDLWGLLNHWMRPSHLRWRATEEQTWYQPPASTCICRQEHVRTHIQNRHRNNVTLSFLRLVLSSDSCSYWLSWWGGKNDSKEMCCGK